RVTSSSVYNYVNCNPLRFLDTSGKQGEPTPEENAAQKSFAAGTSSLNTRRICGTRSHPELKESQKPEGKGSPSNLLTTAGATSVGMDVDKAVPPISDKPIVTWSGGLPAKTQAEVRATEIGGNTLEMTPEGRALDARWASGNPAPRSEQIRVSSDFAYRAGLKRQPVEHVQVGQEDAASIRNQH